MKAIKLRIKKLNPKAVRPSYQTAGAACFDLPTVDEGLIMPGESKLFGTGLAFAVPAGWVMKVYSRSGHGFKHGVRLANGTGIIDSDYRGELMVKLHNDSPKPFQVLRGARIAQAMLEKVTPVAFMAVDELPQTERGNKGFGSTGS